MNWIFIGSLLFCLLYIANSKITYNYVTCGSAVKLQNGLHSVRLHSHDVKYGSGSGQQSVTGVDKSDDHNSYWQIRDKYSSGKDGSSCPRGQPVKCNQVIRLTHLNTQRNLHSHHFASPLTHNYEVSAFGEDGVGDEGDDWMVECSGEFWLRSDSTIRFKHVATDSYLTVSGERYGRPIAGQAEVSCVGRPIGGSNWGVAEGVYVKPNTEPMPGQSNLDEDSESPREAQSTNHFHDDGDL